MFFNLNNQGKIMVTNIINKIGFKITFVIASLVLLAFVQQANAEEGLCQVTSSQFGVSGSLERHINDFNYHVDTGVRTCTETISFSTTAEIQIDEPLLIYNPGAKTDALTIDGAGDEGNITLKSNLEDPYQSIFVVYRNQDITFKNLVIDGNSNSFLRCFDGAHVKLQNIEILNNPSNAIYLENCEGAVLENVTIRRTSNPLAGNPDAEYGDPDFEFDPADYEIDPETEMTDEERAALNNQLTIALNNQLAVVHVYNSPNVQIKVNEIGNGLSVYDAQGTVLKVISSDGFSAGKVYVNGLEEGLVADFVHGKPSKINIQAIGVQRGVRFNDINGEGLVLGDITLDLSGNFSASLTYDDLFEPDEFDADGNLITDPNGNRITVENAIFQYGLKLDVGATQLKFKDLKVSNFVGDGVVVQDASNYNEFKKVVIQNNLRSGVAISAQVVGTRITGIDEDRSQIINNRECGIKISGEAGSVVIPQKGVELQGNGLAGCPFSAVGSTSTEILEEDQITIIPTFLNESVVFMDLGFIGAGDDGGAITEVEIHRLSRFDAGDSSNPDLPPTGSTTSFLNNVSINSLPGTLNASIGQHLFALVRNESQEIKGYWKGRVITSDNELVDDKNCIDNPMGSGQLRIYNEDPVTGDYDLDGLLDHEEDNGAGNPDLAMNCIRDAGETNPYYHDSDGDGIDDEEEVLNGLNPNNAHSDNDGLTDFEEVGADGVYDSSEPADETNALLDDTDGDELNDGEERARGTNPRNAHTDNDGIPDGADLCPTRGTNELCYYDLCRVGAWLPSDHDTDEDGINDDIEDARGSPTGLPNCQPDPLDTDPHVPDTDGDGILDGMEDYNNNGVRDPDETDPLLTDTDGDCIPDGKEDKNGDRFIEAELETDPLNVDTDGDGLPDGKDLNGIGEDITCDGKVDGGETDPAKADTDGDGIADGLDNCPFSIIGSEGGVDNQTCVVRYCGVSGHDIDSDGDGLMDKAEVPSCIRTPLDSDPFNPDTDGDGLNDAQEECFGTSPNDPDSDGDGRSDFDEVKIKTTDANGNEIYIVNPTCSYQANRGNTNPLSPNGCSLNKNKDATSQAPVSIILLGLLMLLPAVRFKMKKVK